METPGSAAARGRLAPLRVRRSGLIAIGVVALTLFMPPSNAFADDPFPAKLDVSPQGSGGSVQATVVDPMPGEGVSDPPDSSAGVGECHDGLVSDVSDGSAHCVFPYLPGRVVTLTATPSVGEPFEGWGRFDCPATSTTCVITMSSNHESVTALFGATTIMHVLIGGLGGVTSTPPGLVDNSSGGPLPCASTAVNPGPTCDLPNVPMLQPVHLTVTPDDPNASVEWSQRCEVPVGDPDSCIVTMAGVEWITVSIGGVKAPEAFPPAYDIVFTVSHTGSGTVSGSRINCGSTCSAVYPFGLHDTVVAAADPGFHFVTWQGACSTTPTCSLWVGPTSSLLAVFAADPSTPSTTNQPAQNPSHAADTAKLQLAARVVGVQQTGHRRTRVLLVRLSVNHAATLRATLQRGRLRVRWSFKLHSGAQTVRIHVPRAAPAGSSRLVLALTDAAGHRHTFTRTLQLRR
jgi:hypothetical protein